MSCVDGRCPVTNGNLRRVQDLLGDRMGKDVFFYSVTLEPERDTVERLREYAEDIFDVRPGWLFLTGERRDIDTLRRAQGFYDPDPERDTDTRLHSSSARIGSDLKQRWNMVALPKLGSWFLLMLLSYTLVAWVAGVPEPAVTRPSWRRFRPVRSRT